jgi:hypothetical protein
MPRREIVFSNELRGIGWKGHILRVWEDGRVQIVPHPAQKRRIMQHANEELGHFGIKQTYNLLLGQY